MSIWYSICFNILFGKVDFNYFIELKKKLNKNITVSKNKVLTSRKFNKLSKVSTSHK